MRGNDFDSERKVLIGTLVVLAATVLLASADVTFDMFEGASVPHMIIEIGVIAAGMVGVAVVSKHLVAVNRKGREASREAEELHGLLEESKADAVRWRAEAQELMRGLGSAIDKQFESWELSPAEKEVALLLMKGFSHKEIAGIRSVAESTTRQQARAVYKKAGLGGRNDLSAFFLEDLMLPGREADAKGAESAANSAP